MDINGYKEKMDKSSANFEKNLVNIRTGRANPQILDAVKVDYKQLI